MKEEDFLEDVHMEGQTPTVAKTTTRNTVKIHRTPEGTPKDEKQVERVVALMRLILTAKKVKEDKVPALIAPNMYLGSIGAAQSEEQIKEKGITHVLTVARGFEIKHVDGVNYMTVEVADRPDADIRSHFPQCFEFIQRRGEERRERARALFRGPVEKRVRVRGVRHVSRKHQVGRSFDANAVGETAD